MSFKSLDDPITIEESQNLEGINNEYIKEKISHTIIKSVGNASTVREFVRSLCEYYQAFTCGVKEYEEDTNIWLKRIRGVEIFDVLEDTLLKEYKKNNTWVLLEKYAAKYVASKVNERQLNNECIDAINDCLVKYENFARSNKILFENYMKIAFSLQDDEKSLKMINLLLKPTPFALGYMDFIFREKLKTKIEKNFKNINFLNSDKYEYIKEFFKKVEKDKNFKDDACVVSNTSFLRLKLDVDKLSSNYMVSKKLIKDYNLGLTTFLDVSFNGDKNEFLKVESVVFEGNNSYLFEYKSENEKIVKLVVNKIGDKFEDSVRNKVKSMHDSFGDDFISNLVIYIKHNVLEEKLLASSQSGRKMKI